MASGNSVRQKEVTDLSHKRKNQLVKKRGAARVIKTIARLGRERGTQNESFAQEVLRGLIKEGKLLHFWVIPPKSHLDRLGMDVIVETIPGFYFLNVKSSQTGVDSFNARRLSGERWIIYPWLACAIHGIPATRGNLYSVFKNYRPSCLRLPPEIRKEIGAPTLSHSSLAVSQ